MTDPRETVRRTLRYRSQGFRHLQLVVVELLTMLMGLSPGLVAWVAFIQYVRAFWDSPWFPAWMLLAPAVLVTTFLLAVRGIRALLPAVQPGVYDIGVSRPFLGWYLTLCLGHAVRIAGLQPFFFAFYTTKYLYWRAMGARIAFGVNSSIFAILADYPLLTVGKGCTLGAHVFLSGHTFVGNKVLLGQVELGDNVYLGMGTVVGPRTTIGAAGPGGGRRGRPGARSRPPWARWRWPGHSRCRAGGRAARVPAGPGRSRRRAGRRAGCRPARSARPGRAGGAAGCPARSAMRGSPGGRSRAGPVAR
jgi:acetyltransferase-like isoleucine patch superfamily enzyme